jgi:hypothetical protein
MIWLKGKDEMFIYLDESGDLGFDFSKVKTTRKFVIAALVCFSQAAERDFKKAIRRTLKKKVNRSKNKSRWVGELKGTGTSLEVKEYFFRQVRCQDWAAYALVLNKARVKEALRTKLGKKKLYNFLARFLIEKLPIRQAAVNVRLVIDRSKNRDEISDFNQYVENHLQAILPLNTGLTIEHLTSHERAGLQAVDLFCWGIARKYERGDLAWYNLFKHMLKYEDEYLREL